VTPTHRLRALAAATAVALVGLTGCTAATSEPSADTRTAVPTTGATPAEPSDSPAPDPSRPGSEPVATPVAEALDTPWGLVALPDGTFLVSQRDDRTILHIDGEHRTTVATLAEVRPGGEGGLLGLAASPDARTVLAYFTAEQDNRIVSMSWDGSALGAPTPVFTGIPKAGRHNGGRLVIGPDGLLYVGTGDSGDSDLAQDRASLGGKILRLRLDGRPAPGNPFDSAVYSYGHRNVQGLAFDDAGRLWASEFGDQTWDELNLITAGGNYGWPLAEGSGGTDEMINPKVVWPTSEASPSGLAFWRGELWMAALRGQRLWEIPLDGTTPGLPVSRFDDAYGRLRSVTVAADGESLLLSASNTDGRADPEAVDDQLLRVTR